MFTTDRTTVDEAAVLAAEQLGRTRFRTPEGYLHCIGVRVARTGPMLYRLDEQPGIEPGRYSMITITRDADLLFDPEVLASFEAKPITNDHPPKMLDPQTVRGLAVGHGFNVRRGEGADTDYMVADFLITDAQAIADVEAGKVQVSPGYDSDSEQIAPGIGRQTEMVGNHFALVTRARGGPSCSIQDEEPEMAKKPTLMRRIFTALRTNDEAAMTAIENELGGATDDDTDEPGVQKLVIEVQAAPAAAAADPVVDDETAADPTEERFAKIETALTALGDAVAKLTSGNSTTDEDADEKDDEKKPTEDEDPEDKPATKTEAMDAMSKAEILAPGIKLPTMDSAGAAKVSTLTALRRSALTAAAADPARKAHVEAVMGGKTAAFDAMPADQLTVVFDAASALVGAANNRGKGDVPQTKERMTPAKLQELNISRRSGQ